MGTPDQDELTTEEVARETLSVLVTAVHELTGIRMHFARMSDGKVAATHTIKEPSIILGTTAKQGLGG